MKISINDIPQVEEGQVVVITVVGRYNPQRLISRAGQLKVKLCYRDGVKDLLAAIHPGVEHSVVVMDRMEYQKKLGEGKFFKAVPTQDIEEVEELEFDLDGDSYEEEVEGEVGDNDASPDAI